MHTDGLEVRIRQNNPIRIDATLSCGPGELLALVGPSGSGKSTVLRTIAGLDHAEQTYIRCSGETWDDSQSGWHVKPQQRRVGLVFQEYALFPHKSALHNVMLAIPGGSQEERRQKAAALLERTNMTGLENRMPSTLSGGQKQRIALARALAREPGVLLLDEPFSAVDQQTRRKLYRELASLRQSLHLPIVLVTHDLSEVQLLADSLCLMHRGSTLQQGPVSSVINCPRTRTIARLVGHQNLFNATVENNNKEYTVYALGNLAPFRGPLLPDAAVGDSVSLLVAPSAIRIDALATQYQPASIDCGSALELTGVVHESVVLGDELSIRLYLDDVPKSLRFRIPMHTAMEEKISQGCRLSVKVPRQGIHAMAE